MVRCMFPALDLTTVNVDFNEIYASARLKTIELLNMGTAPISIDVLAQHSELLEVGERKAISASEGFLFFNASTNESFSSIKVKNVTSKQSQALVTKKKTVVVQPGQRHEVTVASPCSISGVRTQNTNVSWGTIEDKISVKFANDFSSLLNLYKKYFMPERSYTQTEILQDFSRQTSGVTESKRGKQVIFRLQSYPEQIQISSISIESALRQIERLDRVILTLAEERFPGRLLPWFIRKQMTRGLEIDWSSGAVEEQFFRGDVVYPNDFFKSGKSYGNLAIIPSNILLKINNTDGRLAFAESFTSTFADVQEQFRLLGGSFKYLDTSRLPATYVHNPSLISFQNKLFMTLRCQGHKGVSKWYAETFFAEIDESFNITSSYPLIADDSKTHEDARLSVRKDSLFISYVSDVSYKHGKYCTCIEASSFMPGEQVSSPVRPNISDNKSMDCLQKNWLFFEKSEKFILIDNIDPMSVWDITANLEHPTKIAEKSRVLSDWSYGEPRSSTTPIYIERCNQWLTFFHSHLHTSDGIRVYFLGALLFDTNFDIKGYTDVPLFVSTPHQKRFLGANTILPYGCLLKGNDLIMSIGINDTRAGIGILPLDKVMSFIKMI